MSFWKKGTALLLAAVLSVSFASCKNKSEAEESSTKAADWRDKIEYEGAFFVSDGIRLLYALDKGTVTLWDDDGDGDVLQVLQYDTAAADAIERLERLDVNGDGYTDLRVIYSESAERSNYNLWLWDSTAGSYAECPLFRTISNPVINKDGTVLCHVDKGIFGTVEKTYSFAEGGLLDLISSKVIGADETAGKIASSLCGADGAAALEGGVATVEETECFPYSADKDGAACAYIAYSPDAEWYVDMGCMGLYRKVSDRGDGKYSFGMYTGDAGIAEMMATDLSGNADGELNITEIMQGKMDIYAATRYTVSKDGEISWFVVCEESGQWFYSADKSNYTRISPSLGAELGDAVPYSFI